jgi:hypothetical protein
VTPEEFADEMFAIKRDFGGDEEVAHHKADALLCAALNELGYGEGISTYESMDKWYA